jgi:hypothetical protein
MLISLLRNFIASGIPSPLRLGWDRLSRPWRHGASFPFHQASCRPSFPGRIHLSAADSSAVGMYSANAPRLLAVPLAPAATSKSALPLPTCRQGMGPSRWRHGLRVGMAVALTVLLWLPWGAAPAWADDEASSPQPTVFTAPEVNAADIPSEKVAQFVSAYLEVVALIDTRSEELERARTEAESLQIQQDIQRAAYDLIEANGLTRQDYWQLLGLANGDTEFRDRILAQLEERDR